MTLPPEPPAFLSKLVAEHARWDPRPLRDLSDEELLRLPGVGRVKLRQVRAYVGGGDVVLPGAPVRLNNVLRRAGITSAEDLAKLTDAELLTIPNLSRTSLLQVRRHLNRRPDMTAEPQPLTAECFFFCDNDEYLNENEPGQAEEFTGTLAGLVRLSGVACDVEMIRLPGKYPVAHVTFAVTNPADETKLRSTCELFYEVTMAVPGFDSVSETVARSPAQGGDVT